MRLLHQRRLELTDREHFYSFSAQVMRFILIDYARSRKSGKRGGANRHIPLHEEMKWISLEGEDVLVLIQALDELAAVDPGKVRLIELRYFLGCTADEAADTPRSGARYHYGPSPHGSRRGLLSFALQAR